MALKKSLTEVWEILIKDMWSYSKEDFLQVQLNMRRLVKLAEQRGIHLNGRNL